MESDLIFHKYPSQETIQFHPSINQKEKCKKTTHYFTFLLHLLISSYFLRYPSQKALHFSTKILSLHQCNTSFKKKKAKWKKNTPYFNLLTCLLICCFPFVLSTQSWDGIIVTEADFQALQSFKQGLIDPNGFLKSWNDSGCGACSGGWDEIKCAQGQVIVIQLPWRGLGGRITSKIGQFQALRKRSLHDNAIGGLIPKEFGFLPNLRGIQLVYSALWGRHSGQTYQQVF